MAVRNRSGYTRLPAAEDEDWRSQEQLRFGAPPEEVPWGSVALALFLAAFGAAAFVLAWLHWTQAIFGKEQAEIGFTIVGIMTFLPGAYHSCIAYHCWRGTPGYRWSDIPSY
ncbi:hypothetical protein Rsub_08991 [Raphidocelis subcapitata]|uniref:Uncharacterized protein n=1 Tax=Raphidocelis subcapitata TaxID=307507 RepID=A0A2V0PGC2_9CHLO|nr:hypothetical protein Rsub_08991 [Raphidocelis subcapitata]|eukprot:GBF96115.1 hypothetical protein Rsub_08991 [Raphidocelis subcapitata]